MKAQLHSACMLRPRSLVLLATLILCLMVVPRPAQGNSVIISAAEFQRMVYSAPLHTQLVEKPELDASLQVLLELQLLRDSWEKVPPPALELWKENNTPWLLLYGEPYVRYSLEFQDSLGVPGWNAPTITNLRNEQPIEPPADGPQRYFRTVLPVR